MIEKYMKFVGWIVDKMVVDNPEYKEEKNE